MKIKLWIILIVVLLVPIIMGSLISSLKSKISDYKTIVTTNKNQLSYYRNKNDVLVAKQKVLLLTSNEFKNEVDNLIRNNDILQGQVKHLKNVNSILKGTLSVQGSDSITLYDTSYIIKHDTVYKKVFNYNNKYLTFNGIIDKNTIDFNYSYNTDFTYITYWKRSKILKPKILVMDFSLSDPNAKLISSNSIHIKPAPKKFYEKPIFWGITGFLAGILISK